MLARPRYRPDLGGMSWQPVCAGVTLLSSPTWFAIRRIMYLRKVREGKGAKKTNMEPVWITCDDLNTEGILVRCFLVHDTHYCRTAAGYHSLRHSIRA